MQQKMDAFGSWLTLQLRDNDSEKLDRVLQFLEPAVNFYKHEKKKHAVETVEAVLDVIGWRLFFAKMTQSKVDTVRVQEVIKAGHAYLLFKKAHDVIPEYTDSMLAIARNDPLRVFPRKLVELFSLVDGCNTNSWTDAKVASVCADLKSGRDDMEDEVDLSKNKFINKKGGSKHEEHLSSLSLDSDSASMPVTAKDIVEAMKKTQVGSSKRQELNEKLLKLLGVSGILLCIFSSVCRSF